MTSSTTWDAVKKNSKQLSSSKFSFGGSSNLNSSQATKSLKFSKFTDSDAPIVLNLDGNELIYENHHWSLEGEDSRTKQNSLKSLRQENLELQKENHLLRYKLDLLVDMLSTTKLDLVNTEIELKSIKTRNNWSNAVSKLSKSIKTDK